MNEGDIVCRGAFHENCKIPINAILLHNYRGQVTKKCTLCDETTNGNYNEYMIVSDQKAIQNKTESIIFSLSVIKNNQDFIEQKLKEINKLNTKPV